MPLGSTASPPAPSLAPPGPEREVTKLQCLARLYEDAGNATMAQAIERSLRRYL